MIDPPTETSQSPEKNFKLIVEYDGSDYCGWQRQPNQSSIQGALEGVLQRMTREPITLHGSGRTDAGVHALGQTAHFKCATRLSPGDLQKGMNRLLPGDIAVRSCQAVPLGLSRPLQQPLETIPLPDLQPAGKTGRGPPVCLADFPPPRCGRHGCREPAIWWDDTTSNPSKAAAAPAPRPSGRSWRRPGKDKNDHLEFDIRANGFLRYMVRNIVGTLVAVGMGNCSQRDPGAFRGRRSSPGPRHGPAARSVSRPRGVLGPSSERSIGRQGQFRDGGGENVTHRMPVAGPSFPECARCRKKSLHAASACRSRSHNRPFPPPAGCRCSLS